MVLSAREMVATALRYKHTGDVVQRRGLSGVGEGVGLSVGGRVVRWEAAWFCKGREVGRVYVAGWGSNCDGQYATVSVLLSTGTNWYMRSCCYRCCYLL